MTKRSEIILGLFLLIALIILMSSLDGSIAENADTAILMLSFLLLLGLSIYKLAVWFGFRHNPEKRESVVYSGQIYPARIRRWLMDEKRKANTKRDEIIAERPSRELKSR
jgi:hypothetical protein